MLSKANWARKVFLKSIELQESTPPRRGEAIFSEQRTEILILIQTYSDERFGADERFLQKITPFIQTDADVKAIHELVAPDVSLPNLSLQFQDMTNIPELKSYAELSLKEILLKLSKTIESRDNYKEIITVLARISACTPHSADVERCISSNNRLKTKLRSGLKVETENKYLFIHYNMPDLENWNPAEAAKSFVGEKARRERDITTSAGSKSRAQVYYKGVFSDARKLSFPDDEQSEDEELNESFHF